MAGDDVYPKVMETGVSRRDGQWYAVVKLDGKPWRYKGPYADRLEAEAEALLAGSMIRGVQTGKADD